MPDGSLKYNQPELAKTAKVAEQVETLQQQWQRKATEWIPKEGENDLAGLLPDKREIQDPNKVHVPEHMRSSLIKELHESKEYGHAGIEEMVRRLSKVFAIPRMRTKLPKSREPGSGRLCDTVLVI
ncbi:hypothetical protein COCHEDRAFT_1072903, partial [Bipolaris maydis C5]